MCGEMIHDIIRVQMTIYIYTYIYIYLKFKKNYIRILRIRARHFFLLNPHDYCHFGSSLLFYMFFYYFYIRMYENYTYLLRILLILTQKKNNFLLRSE